MKKEVKSYKLIGNKNNAERIKNPSHLPVYHWTSKYRMTEPFLLIVQVVFLILDVGFFFLSIVGNSVVIYVISRDKKLKNKANYHILSVAVADLLIGLIGIPLGIIASLTRSPRDFQLCLMLYSFLLSFFAVSMFSLVAVSVDRFWAVCFPITYHVADTSIAKLAIFCCWFSGLVVGFLPLFGWNSGSFHNKCDIRVVISMNYLLIAVVAIAFTSTLIIIILYVLIYRAVIKQVKKREEIIANTTEMMKQKNEVKAALTLGMIVGTFIVLWMPGIMSFFVMSVTENRSFPSGILELSKILVHMNAAIDPLIYAYRMQNIREAMNNLFTYCFGSEKVELPISNSERVKASVRTMQDLGIL
ncbi:CLUMA_CG014328, isoform A [Clunio marinus]|uniref:CLUMA_CG014328, isoform A n=1 Tax=Clunio marinus TaxID=568069 RepID=A0A1J1ILF2_9DIPT|nr:CLUMA_CG014328, isoform A [Clunio marinus]